MKPSAWLNTTYFRLKFIYSKRSKNAVTNSVLYDFDDSTIHLELLTLCTLSVVYCSRSTRNTNLRELEKSSVNRAQLSGRLPTILSEEKNRFILQNVEFISHIYIQPFWNTR
jgi:hypothetical protein